MDLKSKATIQSKTCDGVTFVVRRLTLMQRARRDAEVLAKRTEYLRLSGERDELMLAAIPGLRDMKPAEAAAAWGRLAPATQRPIDAKSAEANLILEQDLIPADVRAGLVSIEGLTVDGEPVTAANFLDFAPDDLLYEVYRACSEAAGLTAEQQKN